MNGFKAVAAAGVAAAPLVLVAMTLLLLLANLSPLPHAREAATAVAILAVALQFPILTRMARIFCIAGVLAFAAASRLPPPRFAEVELALWQGVAFCALLSMLGSLRAPARRSPLVAGAASYLAGFPTAHRYGAINIGSHFLGLLFNVGVIPLIGTLLRSVGRPEGREVPGFRHMLMAGVRGYALMTMWSPMGLGFAIVTTAIVGLDPVAFLAIAFASAMVLLGLTCLLLRGEAETADAREARPSGPASPRPLLVILAASAGLLGATILVHDMLDLGFIASTVLVLPLFALGWTLMERGAPPVALGTRFSGLISGIGALRTETAIFLSANVIGAAISAFVRDQPAWEMLKTGHYPELPVLMACLAAVPLAGAAFIPHSVFVVLIAQLLGTSPLAASHPVALGLTLTFGWALGISVSPISAMALMTGALAGVPSHVVALSWNRRFALILFGACAAIICLAYYAGL